ncbi:DUF779 domain-containing protein [Xanthomonas perforans]|uniref:Acetaldehyde dehydrogenase n=6 Tax=Xanthomonas TaxID=338 RepID=Q3BZH6_XANE5|nr:MULTISPECIES: DUF779 domain-containing protein [Xanthomonas]MCC4627285.1 DUF779 domain-containing protein [Xanthomonas campestris pv. nigromaculans]OHX22340.1 acetaldehyde dehydrogenase [Xanthomonas alfalfae]WVK03968.1 DUF779 domain-containing protein [Xanthomonas campestris pv. olitorii]AEO40416.1 hypothetical protein XACM_0105 [Xanthomonas euvesicatoria pv. citrumelo F1]AOY67816.1 acetaldehyde dehydrogenase [Xanthomonas euvesicatoria pv. vesicatoria str. 85-10]
MQDSTTRTELPAQVTATLAALQLIDKLRAQHGDVLFHQSGGCCDGSSPMCFAVGEFIVGDRDVLLGEIGGAPFYISAPQFEYWKHTQLIIDVVPGRGGMFSLENGEGVRFLVRSRLFDDDEFARLQQAGRA